MDINFVRRNIVDIQALEIVQHINNHSLVIVDIGNDNIENKLSILQEQLGSYVYHKHSGKHHRDGLVAISASPELYKDKVLRPQNTSRIQNPHTDGATENIEPIILGLHCLERAEQGGESIFVPVSSIVDALWNNFSESELSPLFAPDACCIKRGDRVFKRPVFSLHHYGEEVYITMTQGYHEFTHVIPSEECTTTYEYIIEFVRDVRNQTRLALMPGQSAFFINNELMHGRLEWIDSPQRTRHFIRAWYDGNSPSLKDLKLGVPFKRISLD